jgi:cell division septal protein FtsQ
MKNTAKITRRQQYLKRVQAWQRASLGALIAVGLACVGVLLTSPRFQINQFTAESDRTITPQDIYPSLRSLKGQNFLLVRTQKVVAALQKDPRVKRVSLQKHWQHTLSVRIHERTPTFLLQTKEGVWEVDDALIPFRRVAKPDPKLLAITWEQATPPLGVPLSGTAGKAIQTCLAWTQQEKLFTARRILVKKNGMLVLYRQDGVKVQLGDTQQLDAKLTTLSRLLTAEKSLRTRSDILYINLYYPARPAVRFVVSALPDTSAT